MQAYIQVDLMMMYSEDFTRITVHLQLKLNIAKKLQDDARTPTPAIRYHRCHIENILSHIILRDDIDHAVRGFR